MRLHQKALVVEFLALTALLVAALAAAPLAAAQTTPVPTLTPIVVTATETRPPTATRTPAPTPTPTATLTELQNRLLLADAYLKGGQFAKAADVYSAILTEQRGQPEALTGLQKALEAQAAVTATAAAPRPTSGPATPTPAPTFSETLGAKTNEIIGTALPLLIVLLALFALAEGIRRGLFAAREFFYLHVLPRLHRPARGRPYLIGEFTDATGLPGFQGARIVSQALAEELLKWNQLVQAQMTPVEPTPFVDLGNIAWVKALWTWILPPPRAFRIEGVLLGDQPGAYKLAVQRTDLSTNTVDAVCTFESNKPIPEAAFGEMAAAAAGWARYPRDFEASAAVERGLRAVRSAAEPTPLSAREVYAEAVSLLLPIRQQLSLGAIDYSDARNRLGQAEALLNDLPTGSRFHADLQAIIADLRRLQP